MKVIEQRNEIASANQSSSIDIFTFGEPVPVLEHREILDSAECWLNRRWYEPPISFAGLAKSLHAGVHHSSAIHFKANILTSTFIPSPYLSRETLKRFVLDFLIFGNAYLEKHTIEAFLAERGLNLSAEKTRVTAIETGFDFLGVNIRRFGNKLLTRPAQKSIQSLCNKLRDIVKGNPSAKQINLIRRLNPVIQGWVQYHRLGVAKKTFGKVDSYLWHLLWRWAKRRHPSKGAKWVKAKYFRRIAHRDWIFAANEDEGSKEIVTLVKASDTPIRRHIKIQSAANPFDPEWNDYFARRKYQRLRN